MSENEQQMQQAVVDLTNEYRRLQRQIDSKKQQLDALLAPNGPAGAFPMDFAGAQLRRYTVQFDFTSGVLEQQENAALVDADTIFRCAYIETFVQAIGTAEDRFSGDDITVQATLPWDQRLLYFDFFWSVRDTGTDREWVTPPQPSLFAGGGYTGPLWLPRRNILSGGTALHVTIDPFISQTTGGSEEVFRGFFLGGTIQRYQVQFCFVGHETPARSAP